MTSRVYRFNESVAVSLRNNETVYLAPIDAERIAQAMLDCVADVLSVEFTRSNLATVEV